MKKILKALLPLSVVATSVPAIAATSCGEGDNKTITFGIRPEEIKFYKPVLRTFESITGWKVKLAASTNATADYSDWKNNNAIPDLGFAINANVWEQEKLSQPMNWLEVLKDEKYNLPGITYRIDLDEKLILSKYLIPIGTTGVGTIYDESRLIDKNGNIEGEDEYGPVCTAKQMTNYINGIQSGTESGQFNYAETPNTPLSNVSADNDSETSNPKNWKIAHEKMSFFYDNVAVVAKKCFAPRGTKMQDGSIIETPWTADPRLDFLYADSIQQAIGDKSAIKNHIIDDSIFTKENMKNPKTSAWMYQHYFKYQSQGIFDYGARTQITGTGHGEFIARGEAGIISPGLAWMLKFIRTNLPENRKNSLNRVKTLATDFKPKGIDGLAIGPTTTGEKKTMAIKLMKLILNDQQGADIVKFNYPHINKQTVVIQKAQLLFDSNHSTGIDQWAASRALPLFSFPPDLDSPVADNEYDGNNYLNLSSGDRYNKIVEAMMNQIHISKLWGMESPRTNINNIGMGNINQEKFQSAWNGWVDEVWSSYPEWKN